MKEPNRDCATVVEDVASCVVITKEMLAMQGMWRAVITQALIDAASQSKKKQERMHKIRAVKWLTSGSDDFYQVCWYANMDPKYVMKQAQEALKRNCKWRNDHRQMLPIGSC